MEQWIYSHLEDSRLDGKLEISRTTSLVVGAGAEFARNVMRRAQKDLGARRSLTKWRKTNGMSSAQSLSLCQSQAIAIVALAFVDVEPFLVLTHC